MSTDPGRSDRHEDERPLAAYALLAMVFNALFGAFLVIARRRQLGDALAGQATPGNLLLLGIATHKLSRLIAKDRVTSPLRAPFAIYESEASASEVNERPIGRGIRRAIGDLLTCPFCVSQWVAAFLGFGAVLFPRVTRFVASIAAVVAISDLLNELVGLLRSLQKRAAGDESSA
jgi:hypothetical protein